MAFAIPSDVHDVCSEWREKINNDEKYNEQAQGWGDGFNGDFLLTVEPDELYGGESIHLAVELENGSCKGLKPVGSPEDFNYGYKMSAPYKHWRGFLESNVGDMRYVNMGLFEIEGDMDRFNEYEIAHARMAMLCKEIAMNFEF